MPRILIIDNEKYSRVTLAIVSGKFWFHKMKRLITKIKDDGMFLELLDHSKWAINPLEAKIACSWLPTQHVEISEAIQGRSFRYEIKNIDTGQAVFALKI